MVNHGGMALLTPVLPMLQPPAVALSTPFLPPKSTCLEVHPCASAPERGAAVGRVLSPHPTPPPKPPSPNPVSQNGITKLKRILEGEPEEQFNVEEYMNLYTCAPATQPKSLVDILPPPPPPPLKR